MWIHRRFSLIFGHLLHSSEIFGSLRNSSEIIENCRRMAEINKIIYCPLWVLSRNPHSNPLKFLNRYSPESGKRNEINILKSSPRFRSVRDILRRNDLPKLIDRYIAFQRDVMLVPIRMGTLWWPDYRNIRWLRFASKRGFISRGTHKL